MVLWLIFLWKFLGGLKSVCIVEFLAIWIRRVLKRLLLLKFGSLRILDRMRMNENENVADSTRVEQEKDVSVSKSVDFDNSVRKKQREAVGTNKKEVIRKDGSGGKSRGSVGKAWSLNRFAIIAKSCEKECYTFGIDRDEENDIIVEEVQVIEPRKARAASAGVAELMKSLKVAKNGPINKGKNKFKVGSASLGGQTSNNAQ